MNKNILFIFKTVHILKLHNVSCKGLLYLDEQLEHNAYRVKKYEIIVLFFNC